MAVKRMRVVPLTTRAIAASSRGVAAELIFVGIVRAGVQSERRTRGLGQREGHLACQRKKAK